MIPTLFTARTSLSRLNAENLAQLEPLVADPFICKYLLDGRPRDHLWCHELLRTSDASFSQTSLGLWLVYVPDHPRAVGFAGWLELDGMLPTPQLVYALLPSFAGRGLGTEIATALVCRARSVTDWRPLFATVDPPNLASVRVLENSGFVCCHTAQGRHGPVWVMECDPPPPKSDERLRLPSTVHIDRTWNGQPAPRSFTLQLGVRKDAVVVDIDAPYLDNLPPSGRPGSTDRLWEHEVVELFLLGKDERYLELEFGPHGHYLVLALRGARRIVAQGAAISYQARIDGERWTGLALIPKCWIPPGLCAFNAYAIHWHAGTRHHLAHRPVPGSAPNFHQLAHFAPL